MNSISKGKIGAYLNIRGIDGLEDLWIELKRDISTLKVVAIC
ncbi:hypothetical protein PMIT1303_00766 [Prochlorococcus sp. MIT 1303]|nr:hypothetical protein PMIT1303_00766 [Prochlorococcus sp. MIT 1303]